MNFIYEVHGSDIIFRKEALKKPSHLCRKYRQIQKKSHNMMKSFLIKKKKHIISAYMKTKHNDIKNKHNEVMNLTFCWEL